jgi:hypothetical protein
MTKQRVQRSEGLVALLAIATTRLILVLAQLYVRAHALLRGDRHL